MDYKTQTSVAHEDSVIEEEENNNKKVFEAAVTLVNYCREYSDKDCRGCMFSNEDGCCIIESVMEYGGFEDWDNAKLEEVTTYRVAF